MVYEYKRLRRKTFGFAGLIPYFRRKDEEILSDTLLLSTYQKGILLILSLPSVITTPVIMFSVIIFPACPTRKSAKSDLSDWCFVKD